MSARREELLDKSLDYLLQHSVAGLSLRPLAAAIGTSGRLLVYHFGSKDGLVTAVMDEVRTRLQRSFSALSASSRRGENPGLMRAFWSQTIRSETLPYLRLLFEMQILALQNPAKYARYVEGTSTSWLELIEGSLPPSRDRRATATLCVAVIDGLLLEYMSTGDARRTTQALKLFERLLAVKTPPEKRGDR
jgi:AcrR family transcriptional regulator